MADKHVRESFDGTANRCERAWHICHQQKHDTSGTYAQHILNIV